MKVEIRDITKEEAVPYGDNADIVLAERKSRFGMGRRRKPSSTMTGTEPLHTTARSIRISKKENKK